MTFIEFIGFIITMAAFFFLIVKQVWEERKRRRNPEVYEEEERREQEEVKHLLRSLNIEVPEEEPEELLPLKKVEPPPIPVSRLPKSLSKKTPLAAVKKREVFRDPYALRKPAVFQDAYTKRKEQQSRVIALLKKTDSLKHAVILKEVLDKPKGLK